MSNTTNTGSVASYAFISDDVTLTNLGTIGGPATGSAVTTGSSGDTVANTGTIHGTSAGITASQGISVTNSGAGAVIYGGTDGITVSGGAGSITNAASIGGGMFGIYLKAGGFVSNQSGGTVTSNDGFTVQLAAGGTVINAGSIAGDEGVRLISDGVLTNQSDGMITGAAAVSDYGGSTVVNFGSIIAATTQAFHQGVDLGQNSVLINQTAGLIAGYFGVAVDVSATVVNYGTIVGGEKGVQLFDGGTLTNQSGGTIEANNFGVWATGPATVVNAGSVEGTDTGVYLSQATLTNQASGVITNGARLADGATLLNAGTITGSLAAYLNDGAVLTNQSGGTISGSTGAEVSSAVQPGGGTVVNDGSIIGSSLGVELLVGGSLINQVGGTISGGAGSGVAILGLPTLYTNSYGVTYTIGYTPGRGTITNAGLISGQYGVQVFGSFATVTDSGTIAGSTAAIAFAAGYADRLVLDPGASIVGSVIGNGGVLELASGASAGTLNNLGSQFSGFPQVFVDAGADWVLNGTDTFAAGTTLTTAGTLDGSGGDAVVFAPGAGNRLVLDPGATFVGAVDGGNPIGGTNASVLELASAASTGTLNGLGTLLIDFSQVTVDAGASWVLATATFGAGMTLTNAGTLGGSVSFAPGAGNRVVADPSGVFLGTVDGGNPIGGAATSVLELGYGPTTGTLGSFGTQFIDFGEVAVDVGATWYLSDDAFAAGMTLVNAGTLSGPGGTAAVFQPGAGNRVVIDQGGTFIGTVDGGNPIGSGNASVLELATGSGYAALSGIGTQFTDFSQVTVDAGAYWTLTGANTIGPGATLTVAGELINTGALSGNVTLAGGTILNQSGGTITGAITGTVPGVTIASTVSNAGTIDGAVSLAAGYANRVVLYYGAVFGNTVNGGGSGVLELGASGETGTLTGFGTKYTGFNDILVYSSATWNIAGNVLPAGTTLTNAGTIEGSPDAVRFAAGAGNRVVIDQGGTFSGIVNGGNALGSANQSTLELATGFDGASVPATLSGLGTQFIDFAAIDVDSGATWGVAGSNTIAAAATLTVSGYLGNYGTLLGNVTLAGSGDLRNNTNALVSGVVTGTGTGVSLKNLGTVVGAGNASVTFSNGGGVYNDGGISGASYGVRISGGYGALNNQASIGGTVAGVAILAGGSLYNFGTVTGASAAVLGPGGGTVANYGRVAGNAGTGNGVLLQAGGYVHNGAGGTISGAVGVLQTAAGAATVSNAGTISGTTDSVLLHAGAANRVVVYQGALFNGVVDGGNLIGGAAVSTLELASSSTPGVISGLGSKYIDFAQVVIDPGAQWSLGGTNTVASGVALSVNDTTLTDSGTLVNDGVITLDPSSLTVADLTGDGTVTIASGSTLQVQGTIGSGETIVFTGTGGLLTLDSPDSAKGSVTQLSAGNYIDLVGIDPTSVTFAAGELDFTGGGFPLTFGAGSTFEPAFSDGNGGAAVGAVCFCTGSRIATPQGEVPVERLAVGDMVLTASGATRPIVWIGIGHLLAVRGQRRATTPIVVRKGALADNVPHRHLRVTKGHSFLLDGVLIPVEFLVNHRSILWDDVAQQVTIYHIELETHDVLLANGAPAESYRDDGNRRLFHNANSGWDLPPKLPCAPVLTGGPVVDAVWWRLVQRAGKRPGLPLTDNPDLHLVVDGCRLDAVSRVGAAHVFRLPVGTNDVRLVSRAAAPQELGLMRDPRVLGVAIRRLVAIRGARKRMVEADDERLTHGFHGFEVEAGSGAGFRWTDGDAVVPPVLFSGFDGEFELEVMVVSTARYIADHAMHRAA